MNLLIKNPNAKIKNKFKNKMDIFKRNRQAQSDILRSYKEDTDYQLMKFTLVTLNELIKIVQTRSEFMFVPALRGKRGLIFSKNQQTWAEGTSFSSMLPDGSFKAKDGSGVVLDTIHVDDVFWILDVLFWKDVDLVDCEAETRSFWLSAKYDSCLGKVSRDNQYSFQILPRVDGSFENWSEIMKDWIDNDNFDGILVYNKHSYYLSGQISPLCLKISKDLWTCMNSCN
jgi:hypothetical protein